MTPPSPFMQHLAQRGCITAKPDDSIATVITLLKRHRIGALVICDADGKLEGILSERDIVRALGTKKDLLKAKSSELMTRRVITTGIDTNSSALMQTMTKHRIRHVPIVEGGRTIGIVSIGDVVKRLLEKYETETEQLKQFIYS